METWSEAEWRKAEFRRDDKIYVEPEVEPFMRSTPGKAALVCLMLATLLIAMWGLSACADMQLSAAAPQSRAPAVWVASSLERIGQTQAAGTLRSASLQVARRETESFQLGIRGERANANGVNVTASALSGPGGATLPASTFIMYREHYVFVSPESVDWFGSNPSEGEGWYPDGLIPFVHPDTGADLNGTLNAVPFNVPRGTNQVVWVDVTIPANAAPGNYSGNLTVTASQGGAQQIPVTVTVPNVALPLVSNMRSSFDYWDAAANVEWFKVLLQHRLQPLRAGASREAALIPFGLGSTHMGFWSGADISTCTMSPAPSVGAIQTEVNAHNPALYFFDFSADEISDCPNLTQRLIEWGQAFHQTTPTVDQLVVMIPQAALLDDGLGTGRPAVDVFVVLPKAYDQNRAIVDQARAAGSDIWSYNALSQDGYTPKWLIDYSPMNFIVFPMVNFVQNLNGLLYWRIDRWEADAWNDVNNVGAFHPSNNYPGDGMMVYPGVEVGLPDRVVPSMRLKWLRDGADIYDFAAMLDQRGDGAFARSTLQAVAPDWFNWTRDPAAVLQARTLLLNRLAGSS